MKRIECSCIIVGIGKGQKLGDQILINAGCSRIIVRVDGAGGRPGVAVEIEHRIIKGNPADPQIDIVLVVIDVGQSQEHRIDGQGTKPACERICVNNIVVEIIVGK